MTKKVLISLEELTNICENYEKKYIRIGRNEAECFIEEWFDTQPDVMDNGAVVIKQNNCEHVASVEIFGGGIVGGNSVDSSYVVVGVLPKGYGDFGFDLHRAGLRPLNPRGPIGTAGTIFVTEGCSSCFPEEKKDKKLCTCTQANGQRIMCAHCVKRYIEEPGEKVTVEEIWALIQARQGFIKLANKESISSNERKHIMDSAQECNIQIKQKLEYLVSLQEK